MTAAKAQVTPYAADSFRNEANENGALCAAEVTQREMNQTQQI